MSHNFFISCKYKMFQVVVVIAIDSLERAYFLSTDPVLILSLTSTVFCTITMFIIDDL